MTPARLDADAAAHSSLFWTVGLTLIATQVLALWLLCSHQMDKAEARHASLQVERIAFDDCLQYLVGSTIGACVGRLGMGRAVGAPPAPAEAQAASAMSAAVYARR